MSVRFRNRPVEVEAIRWIGEENCAEVFAFAGKDHAEWADETDHSVFYVPGLLDTMTARHGDWLVRDKHGVTVMRDAEFRARYEETPQPEPFDPATNYHDSVDHLRHDLMTGNAHWNEIANEFAPQGSDERPAADIAAFSAALMAGSYGYTLAAVLGYASKYGEHVAHDLACVADEVLTNGDFDGLNKDVTPSE